MSVSFHDYYKTLGVDRKATEKEIKTAYRKLARQWHPDIHTGKDKVAAEEKFKLINEAYEVLKDQEKRAKYDQLGANWQEGQEFRPPPGRDGFSYYTNTGADSSAFSDFFESLFGGGDYFRAGHTAKGRGPTRGQDIESNLDITLEEAYRGGEKSLQLTAKELCQTCGGTGSFNNNFCGHCGGVGTVNNTKVLAVKIPAGVHEGSSIRLKGQGGEGSLGGEKGDLYLKVHILPHYLYTIKGHDLEVEIKILPEQAVLGDEIKVPTIDGTVSMKIPVETHNGSLLRLKGKGLPFKGGRGDELVRIKIDISDHLGTREKEIYKNLAELRKGV